MGVAAITGTGGYIGQRLIVHLENQGWSTQPWKQYFKGDNMGEQS